MKSNFEFLKEYCPALAQIGETAEIQDINDEYTNIRNEKVQRYKESPALF